MQLTASQLDDILGAADVFIENGDDFSPPEDSDVARDARVRFLDELNSVLATGSSAGTHAYDMMAAVEEINAGQTATLIELVAAVVMWKRQENPLPDPISVTFTPADIDAMQRAYQMDVKRDGMHLTVTLTAKTAPTESWQLDEGEDGAGAREQAEKPPERPVWAIRTFSGALIGCEGRDDAEETLHTHHRYDMMAAVENRFCLHETCPSTRCNQGEVTSNA